MNKEINNNIQEAYCSVEIIKLLQEKGFDVICNKFYNKFSVDNKWSLEDRIFEDCEDYLYAPTLDLAIEWIRVNFDINIWVDCNKESKYLWTTNIIKEGYYVQSDDWIEELENIEEDCYNTPQEAKEMGILYTLKNLI